VAALARSLAQGRPVLACDTRPIDDLLRSAASADERLRRSGRSVADVRRSLDESTATYRQAIRAMDELEGQIDQDRPRVQELWGQVGRWSRQLAAYREGHADDPHAVQALDLRLGEIENGLAELERQWSRSAPTAGKARRDLEALWYRVGGDVPLRGTGRVLRVREIQGGKRP
jgi:DNA repair ATPase RecN